MRSNEIWFYTGSQHLYGEETLRQVDRHSSEIVSNLNSTGQIPVPIVFQRVLTSSEDITAAVREANYQQHCIGIIVWMHTFSPAKMWINGMRILHKPLLHLHTQFNRDIPWDSIDMDFMNLNQSAHGDRETAHLLTRMNVRRKTVVGHFRQAQVVQSISEWSRAVMGWNDLQEAKFVRFGDNMRFVSVTEGDKVEAEARFGFSVNTHGVGDLVAEINGVPDKSIDKLCEEYADIYVLAPDLNKGKSRHNSLREAARIEAGLQAFLEKGNYRGFTTTFEDLHGLVQLPGLAVQRLMQKGYGFAAEGDWKTSAIVRMMKTMATGLPGGNSFMEDYTYHFKDGEESVLGAHMLEICPTITRSKPSCEVHPLGIGGKADPVRLVFEGESGPAINVSLVDMGPAFRLILNNVEGITPPQKMPKLPVARVLWKPKPDIYTAARKWLEAGGAHHTCFSQNISAEMIRDFAVIAGCELVHIQ